MPWDLGLMTSGAQLVVSHREFRCLDLESPQVRRSETRVGEVYMAFSHALNFARRSFKLMCTLEPIPHSVLFVFIHTQEICVFQLSILGDSHLLSVAHPIL
jgi:hypothetical protein